MMFSLLFRFVTCLTAGLSLGASSLVANTPTAAPTASPTASGTETEWISLFNGKNLDGWLARRGSRGNDTSQSIEEMFQVHDGVIHVYPGAAGDSAQFNGNLRTTEQYSSFHLQLEYRWMENRFRPRHRAVRDAGILFHIHTNPDEVWPPSLEMQLGGGKPGAPYVTGDLWVIGNTRALAPSINSQWHPDAPLVEFGGGEDRSPVNLTSVAATKPHGEWNFAELIVHGSDRAEYYLNGQLVGSVTNLRYQDPEGNWRPLSAGAISIQAEWAELQYRNIRIKKL